MNFQMPIPDRDDLPKPSVWQWIVRVITVALIVLVSLLFIVWWILVVGPKLESQNLPMQVGNVDLRRPITLLFFKKDASYTLSGAIVLKKATVWNTTPGPDGKPVPGVLVGELPPVPKNLPAPDTSKPFHPSFDSRQCKALPDGRAECKHIFLLPEAITAKR